MQRRAQAHRGEILAQAKRIVVCLSRELLEAVNGLVIQGERNRSAFVREAIRLLVRQRRRTQASLERLRRGYEEMGGLNLSLAEEALSEDLQASEAYERTLGERENG